MNERIGCDCAVLGYHDCKTCDFEGDKILCRSFRKMYFASIIYKNMIKEVGVGGKKTMNEKKKSYYPCCEHCYEGVPNHPMSKTGCGGPRHRIPCEIKGCKGSILITEEVEGVKP